MSKCEECKHSVYRSELSPGTGGRWLCSDCATREEAALGIVIEDLPDSLGEETASAQRLLLMNEWRLTRLSQDFAMPWVEEGLGPDAAIPWTGLVREQHISIGVAAKFARSGLNPDWVWALVEHGATKSEIKQWAKHPSFVPGAVLALEFSVKEFVQWHFRNTGQEALAAGMRKLGASNDDLIEWIGAEDLMADAIERRIHRLEDYAIDQGSTQAVEVGGQSTQQVGARRNS